MTHTNTHPYVHPYLKPNAQVLIYTDHIEKNMTAREIAAYAVLERYAHKLKDETLVIKVPRILPGTRQTKYPSISHLGTFRQFSPEEYFGESDIYVQEYFEIILRTFALIRHHFPAAHIPDTLDYESRELDGSISSLLYLDTGYYEKLPQYFLTLRQQIDYYVISTQPFIESMPQLAAHRDPNPNNYDIRTDVITTVSIADWETLGLARVGYDEGRFLTYLALDSQKQDEYIALIKQRLDTEELIYFWRVALLRCYREMTSLHGGHYDSRLKAHNAQETKMRMITALHTLALRCQHALDMYLLM